MRVLEKCEWLADDLGFDSAFNYKTEPPFKALKANCPNGIDVYFDNVGGEILGAALFQMNDHGRIACCGAVSQYDTAEPAGGPRGIPGLLGGKNIGKRMIRVGAEPNVQAPRTRRWIGSSNPSIILRGHDSVSLNTAV